MSTRPHHTRARLDLSHKLPAGHCPLIAWLNLIGDEVCGLPERMLNAGPTSKTLTQHSACVLDLKTLQTDGEPTLERGAEGGGGYTIREKWPVLEGASPLKCQPKSVWGKVAVLKTGPRSPTLKRCHLAGASGAHPNGLLAKLDLIGLFHSLTLKYLCINHRDQKIFLICNHRKYLSQLFPLHLNTYVMGRRELYIINSFGAGMQFRRQNLTSMDVRF